MNHSLRVLLIVLLVALSLPTRADFFSQVTPIYEFLDVPSAQDMFGSTGVQISNDGLMLLAASPNVVLPPYFNDGTGSGYPFQFVSGAWTSLGGYLSGPPGLFGYGTGLALSADGSMVFLGFAPNGFMNPMPLLPVANVSRLPFGLRDTFNSPPTFDAFSGFGSTGALSGNGYVVIIGAPGATISAVPAIGEANIYTYNGTVWSSPVAITNPNTVNPQSDSFSSAVAISADGSTALIGSYEGGGTAYLYDVASAMKTQVFNNVVVCQGCMALSSDGQSAIIATDNGVTVYAASDSPAWSGTPISIADPSGQVAMSSDGKAVLIGTYDQKAYLYTLSSGTWDLAHEFDDPTADTSDEYSWAGVALSSDKETVAISAGMATIDSLPQAGAVYVYQSSADLSLSMTANPPLVALNQQVTLDVTVTNNDIEVTAYNVILTDTLPAGLSYVGTTAAGGICSATGAVITCTLTSLAPGGTWQPSLTVQVSTAGAYTDSASVSSNQPDTDTSNNTASASISMLPPTVSNGSVTTNQDTPVNGTLNGSNPCNCGTPVFSVVALPSHGSVSITNTATGAFTYTPTAGYSGADSFTFQLANGLNTSGTATENITVNPAPPTVSSGSVTTNENTAVNGTLAGSNPCSCGTPVFSVVALPSHGSVSITNTATGAFTYTPAPGYSGADSFTFQLANGLNTSGTATESITVNPGGGGGGGSMDFLALGLLGGLLALIQRRRRKG